MDEKQVRAIMLFIAAGTKVLSARLVLMLALFMTFGLFVWAMYLPTPERIGAATLFTLLVFLPSIKADTKQHEATKQTQGE
jgi:hypothetical protein